jgi:hypothetical protein
MSKKFQYNEEYEYDDHEDEKMNKKKNYRLKDKKYTKKYLENDDYEWDDYEDRR